MLVCLGVFDCQGGSGRVKVIWPKVAEGPSARGAVPGWEPTGARSVGQATFVAGAKVGSLKCVYGPGRLWRRGDTEAEAVDGARRGAPQGSRG